MTTGHEIVNLKKTSSPMLSFGPLPECSIVLVDPLLMDQGTNFESLTSNEIYIPRSEREPDSPSVPDSCGTHRDVMDAHHRVNPVHSNRSIFRVT